MENVLRHMSEHQQCGQQVSPCQLIAFGAVQRASSADTCLTNGACFKRFTTNTVFRLVVSPDTALFVHFRKNDFASNPPKLLHVSPDSEETTCSSSETI